MYRKFSMDKGNDEAKFKELESVRDKDIFNIIRNDFEVLIKLRDIFNSFPPLDFSQVTHLAISMRNFRDYTDPLGN